MSGWLAGQSWDVWLSVWVELGCLAGCLGRAEMSGCLSGQSWGALGRGRKKLCSTTDLPCGGPLPAAMPSPREGPQPFFPFGAPERQAHFAGFSLSSRPTRKLSPKAGHPHPAAHHLSPWDLTPQVRGLLAALTQGHVCPFSHGDSVSHLQPPSAIVMRQRCPVRPPQEDQGAATVAWALASHPPRLPSSACR